MVLSDTNSHEIWKESVPKVDRIKTQYLDFKSLGLLRDYTLSKIRKVTKNKNINFDNLLDMISPRMIEVSPTTRQTFLATEFYKKDNSFKNYYDTIVKEIYEVVGFDFYFQKTPNFRIHFFNDGNKNFFSHWHSDILLGHPPNTMNFLFPITENNFGFGLLNETISRFIWKTSDYRFENMQNYKHNILTTNKVVERICNLFGKKIKKLDKVLMFSPLNFHSTLHPKKESFRISMDMRILPTKYYKKDVLYNNDVNPTLRKKVIFKPGDFYSKHSVEKML